MKYHIYELLYNDVPFYIGRTIDPHRRKLEHIRASKDINNKELKYQFIREINSWEMKIIATYTDSLHNYEDYHIYQALLKGHTLTNMRAGDIYTEAEKGMLKGNKVFDEASAFFFYREQLAKRMAEAKKLADKRLANKIRDPSLTRNAIGHVDKVSKGLQSILDRRKAKWKK